MFDRLSIRMYHVGFGDCFLLRFWEGDTAFNILVDCGSITEGAAQIANVADDVIRTCKEPDGTARIGLVVATHRHKDHVGGFSSPLWANVIVGEVWMPWTEDPKDREATRIRNRQSSLALALAGGLTDEEPMALRPPRERAAAAELRGQRGMAINALTNEKAMATLHQGFQGDPPRRFLPEPETSCQARTLADAPGLKIHVLGPPRDEDGIASMDPPSGMGYLTRITDSTDPGPVPAFGTRWQILPEQFANEARHDSFRDDDREKIDEIAEQPFGSLAAALDKAINNTSLILMFEVGQLLMLFPGDAQWGAWNAIMGDPPAKTLLERTTFYKVGHHGSHNATPREFIETMMPAGGTALFSTCNVKQWPNIPRAPLVNAIAGKAQRYARSDDEAGARRAGSKVQPGLYNEWETRLV
jgi:beta-lactamase superfamily II metal-dependent hydrolase